MKSMIYSAKYTNECSVYDESTNTTFIQFPDFAYITDFYKRIENKEQINFMCSKMNKQSQCYILALEIRNLIVFVFTQENPTYYRHNFNETNALNHLFKIITEGNNIDWV